MPNHITLAVIMKKITYLIYFLLFFGCSPKINQHFEHNKYVQNFNIHIVNDSLQLYFKTPADIIYITDKKKLKKVIRNTKFKLQDSVLVYGITDDPPYEYFVTVSKKNTHKYSKKLVVLDTLINTKTIRFIGNSLSEKSKRSLEIDLNDILKSIELGPSYRKQIITVFDIVNKYLNSNKFYAALNEISEFPTYDKQEEWSKLQMELTFSSFLGKNEQYEEYLSKLESKFQINDSISKIIKENSICDIKALDTIIQKAKNHKIIMINENHYYPNHRILISDLLPKLKEIGYNYLALEAINTNQDSVLNLPNAYPTLKTGFYTNEQNYANLIRKAIELDFKFVSYENIEDNKNREIGQADNLYNKTFLIDPNCKVVVLAGIDHILEKPTTEGKEWMATIFKNKYNIDPLTISQTHLNIYRKQINSIYGIISSDYFTNEKLTSIDYFLLNNNTKSFVEKFSSSFQYKNTSENDMQVALFYGKEIDNSHDYQNKIPYYTTIIESRKKTELPINEKQEIYLYAFDKNGRCVDKKIIKSVNTKFGTRTLSGN